MIKLEKILFAHYNTKDFVYTGGDKWLNVYNENLPNGYFYYFHLKDTIHYKTVSTGNFDLYAEYMINQPYVKESVNSQEAVQERIQNFKNLIENFDVNKIGQFAIQPLTDEYVTITDGLHRLAIMLHKGIITDELPKDYVFSKTDLVKAELKKVFGNVMYNEWHMSRCEYAYHSFSIHGVNIRAQRDCGVRLNEYRKHFSFANKNILDFGCNVGGMMIHAHECYRGVGVDYDSHVIEAGQNIIKILDVSEKYSYIRHDFDKDNSMDLLNNEIFANFKPDVIFILSLQAWIKDMGLIKSICDKFKVPVFFEGDPDKFFTLPFKKTFVMNSYDDITGNYTRTTYYIEYEQ